MVSFYVYSLGVVIGCQYQGSWEILVSETTCYVSGGMLNAALLLTQSVLNRGYV